MPESIALNCDCMEYMRSLPDKAFDVVVADPPYNIAKAAWDKWPSVDAYVSDVMAWLREFSRILKDTGSLWMFHSDMSQLCRIMAESQTLPGLCLRDFIVLYKRNFRAKSWKTAECAKNTGLRSFFNVNEYLVHWFSTPGCNTSWNRTGLDYINSNPECYKPLKEWYRQEMQRLGLTQKDIAEKYTAVTGKKPHMLRHYFQDNQFEIPTEAVWTAVYEPLGFGQHEELRKQYEELRKQYEELRNYWRPDDEHCNVWEYAGGFQVREGRFHETSKPVSLYQRILRCSTPVGGRVFDPFLGSGSSRIAAYSLGFDFVGCEIDKTYFELEEKRFETFTSQQSLFY